MVNLWFGLVVCDYWVSNWPLVEYHHLAKSNWTNLWSPKKLWDKMLASWCWSVLQVTYGSNAKSWAPQPSNHPTPPLPCIHYCSQPLAPLDSVGQTVSSPRLIEEKHPQNILILISKITIYIIQYTGSKLPSMSNRDSFYPPIIAHWEPTKKERSNKHKPLQVSRL